MLVYVDEAGDTGFKFEDNSSRYFVMTLVVFAGQKQVEQADRQVEALRQTLRTPRIEFHFAKNKRSIRRAFLSEMRRTEFAAFVLVVDKQRLFPAEFSSRAAFYKAVCAVAFEKAKHRLEDAAVYFDEAGGEKFQKEFAAHLKTTLNGSGGRHIGKVKTLKSAASNLIQLADMICGAVFREREAGDGEYYEIIRAKVETVTVWPE